MKNRTLLLLALLCFFVNGYSTNYSSMIQDSSRWNTVSGGYGSWMRITGVTNTCYKIEGDTSIVGINYKKVRSSTDSLHLNWMNYALVREDTIQKKVWLRKGEKEGLIYNFNVQVGDTFSLFNPVYGGRSTYKVVSIDSILFESGFRKTYSLLAGNETEQSVKDFWIEGIGSEFGPFRTGMSMFTGGFSVLLSFSDGEMEYLNPKFQTRRKTSFSPKITSTVLDTATCNQAYKFQLTTSEVFKYDSVSFSLAFGGQIPNGFTPSSFDEKSGFFSATFSEVGSYQLYVAVHNNGIITDYISMRLEVVNSLVAIQAPQKGINQSIRISSKGEDLTVTLNGISSMLHVVITDLSGKELVERDLNNNTEVIRTDCFPKGIYTVNFFDKKTGQKIDTLKWIRN